MSAIPAIPSLGKSESFGLILIMGLVGFAAYRLYSTGSQLAGGISSTLNGIGTSIGNVVDNAKVAADEIALQNIKSGELITGPATIPITDQSAAETARLNALAGNTTDPAAGVVDPTQQGWAASGIIIGSASDISTSPQQDSPDASGLSVWMG